MLFKLYFASSIPWYSLSLKKICDIGITVKAKFTYVGLLSIFLNVEILDFYLLNVKCIKITLYIIFDICFPLNYLTALKKLFILLIIIYLNTMLPFVV